MNRFHVIALAAVSLFTIFSGLDPARAVEAVKPPMPAARKAALNLPKLLTPDQVKTYVNGLNGFVTPADKSATLRGRVPNACVPYLSLMSAPHATDDGAIPFALMGTSEALDCLKKNVSKCVKADSKECSDFEKLANDPKHGARFHPSVSIDDANPAKFKVTLAQSVKIMNDKSMVMEANADCCNIDGAGGRIAQKAEERPIGGKTVEGIQAGRAALVKAAEIPNPSAPGAEPNKDPNKDPGVAEAAEKNKAERDAKKKASKDDDEDEPEDPEAKRNAARDPTLARVPTDKDMELATAKNMEEYYKQYYSNLMQAQMFQMNMSYQNQLFQLKTQMSQQQNSTTSLSNSWMSTYAPLQSLGATSAFSTTPSFSSGYWPTLTMPSIGSSVGSGIVPTTGGYGR